jgi:hypothetical protein
MTAPWIPSLFPAYKCDHCGFSSFTFITQATHKCTDYIEAHRTRIRAEKAVEESWEKNSERFR